MDFIVRRRKNRLILTSDFAVITIRLFPALITYVAQLANRSRSLGASVPHAANIPKCQSSDVLQEDALKPFRYTPRPEYRASYNCQSNPQNILLWVFHALPLSYRWLS